MKGKLIDLCFTKDKKQRITIDIDGDVRGLFDKFKDMDIDIDIKKYFCKRSKRANKYMWLLCGKIAERLSDEYIHTKDDVYREAIREVGIYIDTDLPVEKANTHRHIWEHAGVGWLTEEIYSDDETSCVRFYYGSSTYSTKQMSRLIKYIVDEAEGMGIPTETPEEIARMVSLWEPEKI